MFFLAYDGYIAYISFSEQEYHTPPLFAFYFLHTKLDSVCFLILYRVLPTSDHGPRRRKENILLGPAHGR